MRRCCRADAGEFSWRGTPSIRSVAAGEPRPRRARARRLTPALAEWPRQVRAPACRGRQTSIRRIAAAVSDARPESEPAYRCRSPSQGRAPSAERLGPAPRGRANLPGVGIRRAGAREKRRTTAIAKRLPRHASRPHDQMHRCVSHCRPLVRSTAENPATRSRPTTALPSLRACLRTVRIRRKRCNQARRKRSACQSSGPVQPAAAHLLCRMTDLLSHLPPADR